MTMAAGMPVSTAVATSPLMKAGMSSGVFGKPPSDLQGMASVGRPSQIAALQPGAASFFAKLQAMLSQKTPAADGAPADATLLEAPDVAGRTAATRLNPLSRAIAQASGKATAPVSLSPRKSLAAPQGDAAAGERNTTAPPLLNATSAKNISVRATESASSKTDGSASAGKPRERDLRRESSPAADASASASAPPAPAAQTLAASAPLQTAEVSRLCSNTTASQEPAVAGEAGNSFVLAKPLAGVSLLAGAALGELGATSRAMRGSSELTAETGPREFATAATTPSNPWHATAAPRTASAETEQSLARDRTSEVAHADSGNTPAAQTAATGDAPAEVRGGASALADSPISRPGAAPARTVPVSEQLPHAIHPEDPAARTPGAMPQAASGADANYVAAQGASGAAHQESSKISAARTPSQKTAAQHISLPAQGLNPSAAQPVSIATVRENAVAAQAAPIRGADSTHGAPGAQPARGGDVFAALDGESAPAATWIHAGPQRAEAGYLDPSLGWVGVRAEFSANALHANIVPATAEAAQMLNTHLAGLNAYMADHPTAAAVSMGAPDTSGWSSAANAGQGMNQENAGRGSAQQFSQNAAPSLAPSIGSARMASAGAGGESGPPAMRSGATISLMA